MKRQRPFEVLAVAGAVLVVLAHLHAGISDEGHAVWRPVGHGTILLLPAYFITILMSIGALVRARGRSIWAYGAIAVAITSTALVASV